MPDTDPPPDFASASLADLSKWLDAKGDGPPVHLWNPDHCGDSEMVIQRDGTWLHQGGPITRPAMKRLFASVLRREEDGGYVLVTPVEKLSIEVEHTPFRALQVKTEGSGEDRIIAFTLDTGDVVIAGPDHPISVELSEIGPSPRLLVRPGLEAEIDRAPWYELAQAAIAEDADPPGLFSNGAFFALG